MKKCISPIVIFSVLCALVPIIEPAHAQEESGYGALHAEFLGAERTPDLIGHWTLIRPNNERTEGDEKEFTFPKLPVGNYVLSTSLPEGMTAIITKNVNGASVTTVKQPQISFVLQEGDNIDITVQYEYTFIGTVTVNSNPSGLAFTLKGPNNSEEKGVTPASFLEYPIGQYTAYFTAIEGCPSIPAQSDKLIKNSRINLSVNISCEHIDTSDIGKDTEKLLKYVSVTIDGKTITLSDVETADWYAPYVSLAAKSGVMSGYKDAEGNQTGLFGPSDHVTIAQLAKIAHEIAGIDEEKIRTDVQNVRAKNTWFERYFASAEQRWWEVWRNITIDPSRPATRAEVLATLLRALRVPTIWAEGKLFSDVSPDNMYAHAIETAGTDGLIDIGGNFRPNDPINRAEMAKIITTAMDLYIENTGEVQSYQSQYK